MGSVATRGPALVVVLATALALVVVACGGSDAFTPIPDVGALTTVAPLQRDGEGRSGVVLPAVGGTTTTVVAIGPGRSRLTGRVEGPGGPLGVGVVRLERLVGEGGAREDVAIRPDGTFDRADILGGRYRVRAFAAPSFAMLQPEIFFLESGTRELVLRVEQFGARDVAAVVAPDPPRVEGRTNLVVRVADRVVDGDGVVRATPVPGVTVTLTGNAGWAVLGEPTGVTSADGEVLFTLVCQAVGAQPLAANLDGLEEVPLGLPACAARPASTTTTSEVTSATTTTAPDDGSSTTSSSPTTSTTAPGEG